MKDFSEFHTRKSVLQPLSIPLFDELGLSLSIKRDDLLHPLISGNKWRKLKYNLFELQRSNGKGIVTFGGAYSNHLHAVAAAGEEFGFKTVGIVRGEKSLTPSPTILSCIEMGMELHFVSRTDYREKEASLIIQNIIQLYPDFILLPEGGANALAIKGCSEILEEIDEPFDYFCTACGTGATLAGLLMSETKNIELIGFPVLKEGEFIHEEITRLLRIAGHEPQVRNCQLKADYHFGGYAKYTPELLKFIKEFENQTDVLLEQVYTGKMMFGIFDLARKGFFKPNSKIVALHTGGLQGKISA